MAQLNVKQWKKWKNNELPVDVHEEWERHLNAYQLKYPRDIGFPWRMPVESCEELVDNIEYRMSNCNVYTDVYSKPMQEGDIYDTYFVDIDGPINIRKAVDDNGDEYYIDSEEERQEKFEDALEDAHWELRKICHYCREEFDGWYPRVYFSGSRGFAIYFDIPSVNVDFGALVSEIKDLLRNAEVDMDLIDSNVFEANRLSRLPYTLNWNHSEKRGLDPLFCLPIDPFWTFQKTLREVMNPEEFKSVQRRECPELAERIEKREDLGEYKSTDVDYDGEIRENPEKALETLGTLMDHAPQIEDGRRRFLHWVLVPNCIEAGFDADSTHDWARRWTEKTNASYNGEYRDKVEESIERTLEGPQKGSRWKAMSLPKFLAENPELMYQFKN